MRNTSADQWNTSLPAFHRHTPTWAIANASSKSSDASEKLTTSVRPLVPARDQVPPWGIIDEPESKFSFRPLFVDSCLSNVHVQCFALRRFCTRPQLTKACERAALQAQAGLSPNYCTASRRAARERQCVILVSSTICGGPILRLPETTEKVLALRRNAAERDRLAQLFAQAPAFMALLAEPEHRFELTNKACLQLVGHRDVVGRSLRETLPELEGQGFFDTASRTQRVINVGRVHGYGVEAQAKVRPSRYFSVNAMSPTRGR